MQHNSPGCLRESFKIPPHHSLQLHLPGTGRTRSLRHFQGQPSPSAGMLPRVKIPNSLNPAVAPKLFRDELLFGCVLCHCWFGFVFFQNKHAECSMLAAFRSNTTAWCIAWGRRRNTRWHWGLLKLVSYCFALPLWCEGTNSRQVCPPWMKGITAGL